jgi:peptidoglycan/LPS O-acetylase OafA/YrhL
VTVPIEKNPLLSASNHRVRRIDDIEWLRAIAVLGVVAHHSQDNLFSWHPKWLVGLLSHLDLWSGVDMFFAISGFVIARSLLPQLDACAGRIRLAARQILAFWAARAFRLLPSAWLWLGLILIAAWRLNSNGIFGSLHANLMATLAGVFQVANFRFADAFASYPYGASFVYWSLSLEEQFYIALPLLALLLKRRIAWLLILVIVIQLVIPRGLLLMSMRTDAIAWGVLLALFSRLPAFARWEPRLLNGHRWLQCICGYGLVFAIAAVSASEVLAIGHRVSIVALLAATLVWIAAYNRNYLSGSDRFTKHLMLWVGHRSYAIYLIHVPAFFLVRELWWSFTGTEAHGGVKQTLIFFGAAALLIGFLAEANFRIVEMPLRRMGRRVAGRISGQPAKTQPPCIPDPEVKNHV